MTGKVKSQLPLFIALIFLLTFAIYGQVKNHAFIDFDDYEYIRDNPHVNTGLTLENVIWAFTSHHSHNWHPITWISHMIDVSLFGLDAGAHHLVNVLIHTINALLVLVLLYRLTGDPIPSTLVSLLFAMHPLHVESVAWLAERKDVLSAFFFLLTVGAYTVYVRERKKWMYSVVCLLFILGLMAKQMLVTLPFVLLLLDYWPLRRWKPENEKTHGKKRKPSGEGESLSHILMEKIPLFVFSSIAAVVVYTVQLKTGVLHRTPFPFSWRIENALTSYVVYLIKTFYPVNLACFYPHPLGGVLLWQSLGAALLLLAVTLTVLRLRYFPYLAVGWFWYLGTLVPVIGLIQVGVQARADRYTYLPLIGIFIMLAWGGRDLTNYLLKKSPEAGKRLVRYTVTALVISIVLVFTVLSYNQISTWRDSVTLYTHAARVIPNNYWAYNNLGAALASEGRIDEAMDLFRRALGIMPLNPGANRNMAVALYKKGRFEEALMHIETALKIQHKNPDLYTVKGAILLKLGRLSEARDAFRETLKLRPGDPDALTGLREAGG